MFRAIELQIWKTQNCPDLIYSLWAKKSVQELSAGYDLGSTLKMDARMVLQIGPDMHVTPSHSIFSPN
jgi:hypothetical protein